MLNYTRKSQNGDNMDKVNEIILQNERLVYSIANYFRNYISKEDLYQAGFLGLVEAYRNYKNDRGTKFSTYAYPYIYGEMKKLVREDKGIKISREISKLNLKIEKAYVLLTQKNMKEPSIKELSEYLNVPEYLVSEAINSLNKIKSIEEPIKSEGKDITLEDIIGKSHNIDDLILLKDCLNKLTKEEKTIIENRYVKDYTQSETSKIVGISQVQVSRKENKVLQKIKYKMTI